MSYVTNEELMSFEDEVNSASKRIGDGKVAMDSNIVRKAVRNHKAAAYRYVELYCSMAASQPGYLQPAVMVAAAYQVEYQDTELLEMVLNQAKALGIKVI